MIGVSYVEDDAVFGVETQLIIIGAGAGGLVAGLAAKEGGLEVVVIERTASPSGSTGMSSGFIPAAGTRYQRALAIDDSPQVMCEDISRKNNGGADIAVVRALCEESASVIEWLADKYGIPFELVRGFLYPGHSVPRMHTTPAHSGSALLAYLADAVSKAGIDLVTNAAASHLYVGVDGRVRGVGYEAPDGSIETVGCGALVLACNGFGGNSALVSRFIPAMKDALYFGHSGNQGDALMWGSLLGASLKDLGSFQGHGSLSWPQQVLISWAAMMEGGIQVNSSGERFSNEHAGYSEQARIVLSQPGSVAWDIFDERIHLDLLKSPDYRAAVEFGAVKRGNDLAELSRVTELPASGLHVSFSEMERLATSGEPDRFGRHFNSRELLVAPYYAVRVTGALFHTQGGLEIASNGRVLRRDGTLMPNLYAVGGAARGISGSSDNGYLSGNGLLSATVMGAIAGRTAAKDLRESWGERLVGSAQ